jgi:triphosphoribosyl-dephospho-CoA synthase
MSAWTSRALADAYHEACAADVQAFKPGNVSLHSPGHGMHAADFLRSAERSAPAISRPGAALGERILDAVRATRQAVACNTNLGIVLLCAPLIQARLDHPRLSLADAVQRVLDATTVADTAAVFDAIRLASPGGLGRSPEHDVSGPASAGLVGVMRHAAARDMIARQYAEGFAGLLGDIQPRLATCLAAGDGTAAAVRRLYIDLLGRYPDSHVQRRHGVRAARELCREAERLGRRCRAEPGRARMLLTHLDRRLKARGVNPGTTADLCVAALLSHRLQSQALSEPGATRAATGPAVSGGFVPSTIR